MLQFLRSVLGNPDQWAITRLPGEAWKSSKRRWRLPQLAEAVWDDRLIVGIRPRGPVRAVWVDIDRHDDAVSPYWHPYGEGRQVRALEREAAAAGCGSCLLRSSASGGLHAVILLPEAVPAWLAHWIASELVARAGMTQGAGICEVFPSRLDYSDSTNPADWAKGKGVRLPGQEGSALLIGTTTASDTALIYEELQAQLEGTSADARWQELLEAAHSRRKAERQATGPNHRPRPAEGHSGPSCRVIWDGQHQSNDNIGRITTWARCTHPWAVTVADLAPVIEAAALAAAGFEQFASAETKRNLRRRCEEWARSSLKRDWRPGRPQPEGGDPGRNERLMQQARQAIRAVLDRLGEVARHMSQRALAAIAGVNVKTLRRHWDSVLHEWVVQTPPISVPTTGAPSASDQPEENKQPDCSISPLRPAAIEASAAPTATPAEAPAQSSRPSIWAGLRHALRWPADRVERPRLAESIKPPPDPPPDDAPPAAMPFKPEAAPADPWRVRQRAELAAWLGLAA